MCRSSFAKADIFSKLSGEQFSDCVLELMLRVWLAKDVRAFDQQSVHLVGNGIARRVEHSQIRPQRDGLMR